MSEKKQQRQPYQKSTEPKTIECGPGGETKDAPYGYKRRDDLLKIVCSLASNPELYPRAVTVVSLVATAQSILNQIESVT